MVLKMIQILHYSRNGYLFYMTPLYLIAARLAKRVKSELGIISSNVLLTRFWFFYFDFYSMFTYFFTLYFSLYEWSQFS